MTKEGKEKIQKKVTVWAYTAEECDLHMPSAFRHAVEIRLVSGRLNPYVFAEEVFRSGADAHMLLDADRCPLTSVDQLLDEHFKGKKKGEVSYGNSLKPSLIGGFLLKCACRWFRSVLNTPFLIADSDIFRKAYVGHDLAENPLVAAAYSLQKNHVKFRRLECKSDQEKQVTTAGLYKNYTFRLPFAYLFSGAFFRRIRKNEDAAQRNMVYRMLFVCLSVLMFVFMPYISKDYGISGDEFVDQRHAGYVLDYFSKGDKAALDQPKTTLHLYGISMQVVAAAVCKWFNIDNYYEARHVICALNGALGILFVGLLGLRWGGGLCGLLALLLMFFTPRYFGHSMNNLKDIPFAVGYIMSIYYTVRLFDFFPLFRIRDIIGLVLGIALALGTRSGGLILYPMVLMYAGFFYISNVGGKEFYKFGKFGKPIGTIFTVLLIVLVVSYFLSIALWPYALQKPLTNVVLSLKQFTNYSIGLRTMFDGQQMMSNMLPWNYAPQYLLIGMPIIVILGFLGYVIYSAIRPRSFSLLAFFLLFAAVFPVFWVIYQNSNLYGGIRHLLFVMPPMVVLAARFWTILMEKTGFYAKIAVCLLFIGLFSLPVAHALRNHPNEYVYFNEFAGGMKGAYGNYETDYYFNSLKESSDWFKKNVELPKNKKTIIVTNSDHAMKYYFRKDTMVSVVYSRYYSKHSRDWDYAIFGNCYIDRFQLQNGLFPPEKALYTPLVDAYPMSYVAKRRTKMELEGFKLEEAGRTTEAIAVFENYLKQYGDSEEIWGKLALLYCDEGQWDKAAHSARKNLELMATSEQTLYVLALVGLEKRDYKEMTRAAQKMLAVNANSTEGLYMMALAQTKTKQYQEAWKTLNKLLSFRSDVLKAHILAGDILLENGQYDKAVGIYEPLLSKYKNVRVAVPLADAYCRAGKYGQAQQLVNEIEPVLPNDPDFLKVKIRLFLMQHKLDAAAELLASLQQPDEDVYILRAIYLNMKQQPEDAVTMLDTALRMDPGNVEAAALKRELKR